MSYSSAVQSSVPVEIVQVNADTNNTQAQITGVAGTFPTGFTGGETLDLRIDAVMSFVTTFAAGDQSNAQVVTAINTAAGIAGVPGTPATVFGGEIRITSQIFGATSFTVVNGGTGAATLGMTGLTDQGTEVPVTLEYGKLYEVNNDGSVPSGDKDLDLPVITAATLGQRIHIKCRYDNDPDGGTFGNATLKRSGSDAIGFEGTTASELELTGNDDNWVIQHDGVGVWYLG